MTHRLLLFDIDGTLVRMRAGTPNRIFEEMLLEVFLCVRQIVLRLDRNHAEQPAKKPDSLCFILKQNVRQKLVEWPA